MEQLSLLPTSPPSPKKYGLFFGIFTNNTAGDLIAEQQVQLSDKFGLFGQPRPCKNLHVTLHHIGEYFDVPEREIAAAIKVGASALAHQQLFDVTFNHVMSFRGKPDRNPFVLVNPSGNSELLQLHRVLVTNLVMHRLAKPKDLKIVPHVTMLYDRIIVSKQPVRPVKWKVTEVVLVLSHLGLTKYERLECWKLGE